VIEGTLSAKRQKEVDVALAVDMLTHAFNHNMGWAHLIAGDLDFRPLVQALVRLGIYVTVWSRHTSASSGLRWAADNAQNITVEGLHHWCVDTFRATYPLPALTNDQPPIPADIIGEGVYPAGNVVLFRESPSGSYVMRVLAPPQQFRVVHADRQCLETFFELEFGKVQWR
jgi:hypothetical protein